MSERRNLVASALGNAWTAIVQVAFVPVYIHLLGVEAYGLIGFYTILQMSLWLLDLGFTPAVSRDVALVLAGAARVDDARSLLRSVECVFGAATVVLGVLAFACAPWIAAHWLNPEALGGESTRRAIELMGLLIAVRLFLGVYRGATTGAGRIVWLSAVGSAFATVRAAGVIPVLWLHPGIDAFFLFQLAATVAEALVMAWMAWSLLPSTLPARASRNALAGVRAFSGAMIVIAALYVVLTQADKVLLSASLPLAEFGRYALAASVAGALGLLAAPVGTVAYPRLATLLARQEPVDDTVRRYTRLIALAVAPAAAVIALFAEPILALWTRDPEISRATAPLLACLVLGTMLHTFTTVPFLLPLAQGRPWQAARIYVALVVLFLPLLAFAVASWGARGAAWAWIAVNAAGVAACWPLMRTALSPAQRVAWLARDVTLPTLASFALAAVFAAVVR